ncbi:chemotaxis protein CheD [Thiomonas bhubaneswarensis]|uniref:Probable chemoreceptor glutamine deamidase CheD n=1 Tax=Thiomonas bhubaneswarensis TaxID=339866 RepID=A0A0K6ICV6_9BURK|nr:chemotaxis protein CheD [Thiomonas bhubaneswarensis]CUB00955.1 Chemotaxis receptor (MCP) glutamine deamidase CheD [Thiomonas bhubaneswarensis]
MNTTLRTQASAEADLEEPLEIFLQPGELYFGEGRTRVRTLLGSCVAIAVWHPQRRIGGLCHYMLPGRGAHHGAHRALDGRYADEAMLLFLRDMRAAGTRPEEYEAKLFGGGRMFTQDKPPHVHVGCTDVPCKNVLRGRELVRQHGLRLKAEHLGGQGHRNLMFEIWSGDAYLKFWGQNAEQCLG